MAGFNATANGMVEVLAGSAPLSRAVAKDRNSPVLVLASAPSAHARAEWESREARALLEHLRRASDFVIIHAPARLEMVPLVSMAEAVLFVGAADQTQALERAAAALAPGSQHLGFVLTA